jgi:predicted site-specific integrase-resolvase
METEATRPNYLTSADVAREFGVDKSTVTRWVAAGRIRPAWTAPGERGAHYFTPEAVAALKAEGEPA